MKNKTIRHTTIAIILIFNSLYLYSQSRISSPYSRFGVGDLINNNQVLNMGMGGLSYGLSSPYFINPSNPATYSAFDSLSFLFDCGLYSKFTQLSTVNLSQRHSYATLGYLKIGFPVFNWWRSSFGLLPYSGVGYKMNNSIKSADFGHVMYSYEGSGGFNKVYFGNSFVISKNISIGVNFNYYFGAIVKSAASIPLDSAYRFSYKTKLSIEMHDFDLNYGLLYKNQMQNNLFYKIGITFNTSNKISATEDRFDYTYIETNKIDKIIDTLVFTKKNKGKIILPNVIGTGFTIGKSNKWQLGADFQYQIWDKFKLFEHIDSLKNSYSFSIGGEYTPSQSTTTSYWQRVSYRAGIRYNNSYLNLRNQQINEFGISFGVGLPMPRTRSTVNASFEIGTKGTKSYNLIKENYFRFTVGVSLFERWFIVKKYE